MRADHGRSGANPRAAVAPPRRLRGVRRGGGARLPGGALNDNEVRQAIYERFVEDGQPPSPWDDAATEAFRRLDAARVVVLKPGTTEIWMAPPLSAVPTDFRVETPRGEFWGNCVWDGLGVIAMLGDSGTVETRCADCHDPMQLRVEDGELVEGDGVAHFAVPATCWWDDIGFT